MIEREQIQEVKQDYFGLFTKPIQTIEKKSYKRLMVYGASIGISFALIVSLSLSIMHSNKESNIKEQEQLVLEQKIKLAATEKAQLAFTNRKNELAGKVQAIDRKNFNAFIDFIKLQQQIYNSRFELVSDAIVNARNNNDKAFDLKTASAISELKAEYQKPYYQVITKFITLYENIQNKTLVNDIGINDINNFLSEYNKYQASVYIPNNELDKKLEFYIYPVNKANAEYNTKNNIINAYKKLKEGSIEKMNQYHTS